MMSGTGTPAGAAICGDLSGNGSLTPGDATLLLQVVNGTHPNPASLCGAMGAAQCGDLNASGSLTVADIVILLNVINGNPTLFPPCTGAGTVVACGGTLSGNINSNRRIQRCTGCDTDCSAFLDGLVFVQPNVTLTIDAGAKVCGKKVPTTGAVSALVFLKDAKINAPGVPCNPIIFSSDQAVQNPGDWGGIAFLGRAPVNCGGGPPQECVAEGLSGDLAFGGNNPNDSSGVMRFVRSEFAGFELSPDNELNGITFNGIGRGSAFDHLQGHRTLDDAIEWFGGTVNTKFLVSTGGGDDQFDWQLGHQGSTQFGFALVRGASLAGGGRAGWEADNFENGENNLPRSNPKICNYTMIGSKGQGDATAGRPGATLRRGTAGTIANSIIMDFPGGGFSLEGANTATQACTTGDLKIQNTLFFNNGPAGDLHGTGAGGAACTGDGWYDTVLGATLGVLPATSPAAGPNPGIVTGAFPTTIFNAVPPVATADLNAPDCDAVDPAFFDNAAYKGAFLPGGTSADNWMITCPGTPVCEWVTMDAN
jgi:hypothetical protein